MLNRWVVIAHKEVVESLRDIRSLVSALFYALMGPLVVGLVAVATRAQSKPESAVMLIAMMSVFTLVSAFVGGMSVAMDTVAGERERRSLLPLLLNPVSGLDLAAGKWIAVSIFATAGLAINIVGFAAVFSCAAPIIEPGVWLRSLPVMIIAMLPLALLAAAMQFAVSAACRALKEAQTYLSMLVFLPMGIGMLVVFVPAAGMGWRAMAPLAGHQLQLQRILSGETVPIRQAIALACLTALPTLLLVRFAAARFERHELVFGN